MRATGANAGFDNDGISGCNDIGTDPAQMGLSFILFLVRCVGSQVILKVPVSQDAADLSGADVLLTGMVCRD